MQTLTEVGVGAPLANITYTRDWIQSATFVPTISSHQNLNCTWIRGCWQTVSDVHHFWMILSPFMQTLNCFALQSYDFIEVFAGKALTSTVIRKAGRDTAALDIDYFEDKGTGSKPRSNYFDILTPSGFAILS